MSQTATSPATARARQYVGAPTPAVLPLRPRQAAAPAPAAGRRARLRIGHVHVDALTFDGALDAVAGLVDAGEGGTVFTANVDHVVQVDRNRAFREAYARASLVFADGAPIVWVSRLLGRRLPEKVSGSDFVVPIARLAARRGWRIYLLGAAPGVAREAAARLTKATGVVVCGVESPTLTLEGDAAVEAGIAERIRRSKADIVLAAFGAPKQELWMDRSRGALGHAVTIGVGASLDFIAGRTRRAPGLVSAIGLEWLFRLLQEPRRLWRRYLVDDPAFLWIVARTLRDPIATRVVDA